MKNYINKIHWKYLPKKIIIIITKSTAIESPESLLHPHFTFNSLSRATVFLVSTRRIAFECTTSNGVDNNYNNKDDWINDGYKSPIFLNIVQYCHLARLTVEAEFFLDIAPPLAISIGHGQASFRHYPIGCILGLEATVCWWLAATRLDGRN